VITLSTTNEIKMIRITEIDIQGAQVTVKYRVDHGKLVWATPIVDAIEWKCCNWLTLIPEVVDALEDHHANLLIEDNADV
jgi:hypothetical protein